MALDLVVACHDLGVARRRGSIAGPSSAAGIGGLTRLRSRCRTLVGAVAHVSLRSRLAGGLVGRPGWALGTAAAVVVDEYIDAAAFGVGGTFIVVRRLGELGDDVPRVDEARDEAEHAEEDVDDGISGADAALHPYRQGREENGQEAEEYVCRTHPIGIAKRVSLS